MDVFVIPIGRDRYELYCEPSAEATAADAAGVRSRPDRPAAGPVQCDRARRGRMAPPRPARTRRARRAAQGPGASAGSRSASSSSGCCGTCGNHTEVVAAHPQDMTFEQVLALIRQTLQHDYDRHRRWMIIDGILFVLTFVFLGPVLSARAGHREYPRALLRVPRHRSLAVDARRRPGTASRRVVGTLLSAAERASRRRAARAAGARRAHSRRRRAPAAAASQHVLRARCRAARSDRFFPLREATGARRTARLPPRGRRRGGDRPRRGHPARSARRPHLPRESEVRIGDGADPRLGRPAQGRRAAGAVRDAADGRSVSRVRARRRTVRARLASGSRRPRAGGGRR